MFTVGCGLLAAAISAALVGNNHVASRLFVDAIPSAALSGAATAMQPIKGFRRRNPDHREDADNAVELQSQESARRE
jgi:hypothetical protein